jgi:hypothetical protein
VFRQGPSEVLAVSWQGPGELLMVWEWEFQTLKIVYIFKITIRLPLKYAAKKYENSE